MIGTIFGTNRFSGSTTIPGAYTDDAMLLSPKGVPQNGSIDEQFSFYKRTLYIIDRIAKSLGIS
jgi:hypothetical protein